MDKKYWVALIKSEESYYLLSSEDGTINSRNTGSALAKEFYSKYNSVKPESLMAHYLQFEPRIVNISKKEMGETLFNLKKGTKVNRVESPIGGFYGLKCNGNKKGIEKIFDEGRKVSFP